MLKADSKPVGDIQAPTILVSTLCQTARHHKATTKLGATSPVSGFMWGIKQGAHAFSCPTGHMHHYRHQTDMQKIWNRNSQIP